MVESQTLRAKQDAQTILSQTDYLVKRSQSSSAASPFLGLALSSERLSMVRGSLRTLSDWKLEIILKRYRYAVSWAICCSLSENYGKDGNAKVWPLIGELLARTLTLQSERKLVYGSFIASCKKLGLASDGFERSVHAFQVHSGVARSQLHHLAKVFIAQERSLGLPDQDDIVELNRWEDDALHFLDAGVHVLQRPILMDHSAWMASAYVDWRLDQNSQITKSDYLIEFRRQLQLAFEGSEKIGEQVSPIPRLVWEDNRPYLSIPGQTNRYKLYVDGDLYRVRAGKLWPLPTPLPSEISWDGDRPGRIDLFQRNNFIVFDTNTGRQVDLSISGDNENKVARGMVATAAVISGQEFSINDEPSVEAMQNVHFAHVDLRNYKVEITQNDRRLTLIGARRPQITIQGAPIAKGQNRPNVWGPKTDIELDFGSTENSIGKNGEPILEKFVQVENSKTSIEIKVVTDGRGIALLSVKTLIEQLGISKDGDPELISVTLLRKSEEDASTYATRYKRKLYVWPGFIDVIGNQIQTQSAPQTFSKLNSKYITTDDKGYLCFDRTQGFTEGRIAFGHNDELVIFAIRTSMLNACVERVDGTIDQLQLGSVLVKSHATASDAIVISSPDKDASLKIGPNFITEPFKHSPTYAIPLSTLKHQEIVHISNNNLPTLIALVEHGAQPKRIQMRSWTDGASISIELPFQVGGVSISVESELGVTEEVELSFDHFLCETPKVDWLVASEVDIDRFQIELSCASLKGLNLVTFKFRQMGKREWSQIRSISDAIYAFPLFSPEQAEPNAISLENLQKWLGQRYSQDIWEKFLGEPLKTRWSQIVEELSHLPGGEERLLLESLRDEENPWLSRSHIIQLIPTIYATGSIKFHAFSNSVGSDRVLKIISDASSKRMRELSLNVMAMMAFPNAKKAAMAGEKLQKFKPEHLPVIFSTLAIKPPEWLANDALGPDHAHTALSALRDRIDTHRILGSSEDEGDISSTSTNINRVATSLKNPSLSNLLLSSSENEDISVNLIENALLNIAVKSRAGGSQFKLMYEEAWQKSGATREDVLIAMGQMITLGRELFIFHLIASEIKLRSQS